MRTLSVAPDTHILALIFTETLLHCVILVDTEHENALGVYCAREVTNL